MFVCLVKGKFFSFFIMNGLNNILKKVVEGILMLFEYIEVVINIFEILILCLICIFFK